MKNNVQKEAQPESHLKAESRREIEDGLATSQDSLNADLPELALRITTIYSPWYTRTCLQCKHRFREGDQIRICPECEVCYHDDGQYNLHCWQERFADGRVCREDRYDPISELDTRGCTYEWTGRSSDEQYERKMADTHIRRPTEITNSFLEGLETEWTPFGEEKVIEVAEDSPIVKHNCPWCRFDIRSGDRVVKCPCGICDAYFHNDIFRHLTCWNDWNGTLGNDYCTITGATIVRRSALSEMESEYDN
jgi:hypothetical protein